uniref:Uncharacterized protein n=1 Tax=Aegilops tauschii subsp. strangulata TaxID=200361 RepID=A0A453QLA3_AEGTS
MFRSNDGGGWDDYGAGRVTIDHLEGSTSEKEIVLAVIDAENKETMLLHLITPDDIYRRRQGEEALLLLPLLFPSSLNIQISDKRSAQKRWKF